MAWTSEQKNVCLDMVRQGCSVAAIKEVTHLTTGQVCGFAKRAGLVMRDIQGLKGKGAGQLPPPPPVIVHRPRVPIAPIPVRKKHVPPKEPVDNRVGSSVPVTILELNSDHCRLMVSETHYCGAVTIFKNGKKTSYCKDHYKRMYYPPNKNYK